MQKGPPGLGTDYILRSTAIMASEPKATNTVTTFTDTNCRCQVFCIAANTKKADRTHDLISDGQMD